MKLKHKIKVVNLIYVFVFVFAFASLTFSTVFYINSINQMNLNEEDLAKKESESFSATINSAILKFTDISARINNDTECKLLKSYYYDILGDSEGKISALNKITDLLENYTETSEIAALVGLRIKPSDEYSYNNLHSSSDDSGGILEIDNILNNMSLYSYDNGLLIKDSSVYLTFADGVDENLKILIKLNTYSFSSILNSLGNETLQTFEFKINANNQAIFLASNFDLSTEQISSIDTITDKELIRNGTVIKYTDQVKDDLYFVKYVDFKTFTSHGLVPLNLMIISGALIVAFLFAFTLFFTIFMNKPIKEIKKGYQYIEEGKFGYQIPTNTRTDFQILYDGFNHMSSSIQNYIDDNYLQQLRIKDSEFKILQSQINPHFLYNCFANISALCKLGDNKKAEILTNNLSLYFKYIMNNNDMYVSFSNEYEHMMQYIEIQKIRFDGRVGYQIDSCKKEFSVYRVPKIIFQPIVENSFKYVYSKMVNGGILRIKIKEENTYLVISFEDNGNILTEKDVEQLNNNIKKLAVETSGIINVAKRIDSYSDSRSYVKCDLSKDLGGLKIIFCLDYETLKNEN